MSLSGDIISDMQMDASIEAIGEIAGSINLDGSGSTPTITASATVSPDPGIPSCNVVKTGTDEYPNFAFNFSGLKGEPGEQGVPGQNGQNGADGSDGITPNLTATASVGASTGTPAVTVTRTGTDENPNFYFQFDNLKGEQGIQGEQGEPGSQGAPGTVPNVSASASVTNTSGIPAVTVTRTGSDAAPNFDFSFENLKGEQGIQGVPGQNGQNGADGSDGITPIVSATASADNSYGIPNVVVTRSGTDAAPSFDFAFHNIKGEPGTSGVPAGGTTGQVLTKESNDDWDCDWQTLVIPSTAAEISFDNTGTGMTATDVQGAVSELKSNLTDSGWQTIATYYEYRKMNGVVYVRKKDTTQISITATFTTIFTLPEGFRPTNSNGSFVYSVPAMAQAQGIQIKVLDTGAVQAAAQFGSNTPVMYQWAISFPLG